MAYSMFTEPVNGVSELVLRREEPTKISITTDKPLTDEQMRDLYWAVLAMHKTGLTLHELFMDKECDDGETTVR